MKYAQKLLPFISIFFVSATILMAQVLMARQSRVAFGFGLEFIIFSFAIAGIGIGGLFVYLTARKKSQDQMDKLLLWIFPMFAMLTVIPFALLHFVNMFEDVPLTQTLDLLFFVFSLLFYFVGGIIVSTILKNHARQIPRLYFFDLLGAAFGAFFIIFLMDFFGTQTSAVAVFAAGIISAILYSLYLGKVRGSILVLLTISIIVFIFANLNYFQVTCSPNDAFLSANSNSFSQINVEKADLSDHFGIKEILGLGNGENPPGVNFYHMVLECQTTGNAFILNYDRLNDTKFLLGSIYNFPYVIRNYNRVVELGSGPGNAIITAALHGVPDIVAVDINPLIINTVKKFVSHNIYADPNVHLDIVEGRNFINTTEPNLDLIYIFTKSFGGVGTSSYAFSENYLFTKEAYTSYLNKLSPSGVIGLAGPNWFISNWVQTLIVVLKDRGLEPKTHLILLEGKQYSLAMVAKNSFSSLEQDQLILAAQKLGFKTTLFTDDVIANYLHNQLPVTDNKPSFINVYNFAEILNQQGQYSSDPAVSEKSSTTFIEFLYLLGLAFVLYLVIAILSFRLKSKKWLTHRTGLVLFFSAVAIGFTTFELAIIQKLSLFLAKPEYPVSIGLASILFFGGLGSLTVSRIRESKLVPRAKVIILAFLVSAILYLAFADTFLNSLVTQTLGIRLAIAVVILAIPGFLIGMIFPIGLRLTAAIDKNLIPWMFAIDGAASVLGGVLSKVVFLIFGFRAEFSIVILMYTLALLILYRKGIGIQKNGEK